MLLTMYLRNGGLWPSHSVRRCRLRSERLTSKKVAPLAMRYIVALALVALCLPAHAELYQVRVSKPAAPKAEGFRMGMAEHPEGQTIGINSRYLTRDGQPWMPVMGEFHFSRCPNQEWREELLRMKAGGIDIVASYVFWNHHEEIEGQWNWSEQRNLRKFVELCGEVGLLAAVRLGPWCHGEVRNGGIPDWALEKGWKLRSNDAGYLDQVRIIYGQIAGQLEGLLWKDGGPVIAVQLENEYRGHGAHLMALKEIACDAGLDVPLYTRTGWPKLASPTPFGEIAPLYGAYAEGFWDRQLRSMPGNYWAAFRFSYLRSDSAIATEQLGERAMRDDADAELYPYLTCELGGGMMSSYHRRILMQPEDILAVALVKVGSGGNLPGYYMYHGGVNPDGELSTLMEQQDSPMTNYNDMPVKNYDFQAPLGAFGQTRPHYHSLRRMHLLFRDFGDRLATMPAFLPEQLPGGKDDQTTLRWAVRSDGEAGFVFVNNHQRGTTLPDHPDVQFAIKTDIEDLIFPDQPATIPSGTQFIWPFGLQLDPKVRLRSATAQLVTQIETPASRTLFFAKTPGIPATFAFANGTQRTLQPSRSVGMTIPGDYREIRIVLLGAQDSLRVWKGELAGRERVVLSRADVLFDDDGLSLRSEDPQALVAWVYRSDGTFTKLSSEPMAPTSAFLAEVAQLREASPPREIRLGKNNVAVAPNDSDFRAASAWKIAFPGEGLTTMDALLRINYQGDVARISLGGASNP